MDAASDTDDDQAELKAARARLRAFAARVAEAVESIAMPETFLDGERAARAVIAADRMVTRLPVTEDRPERVPEGANIIAPARKRLRTYAQRLLSAVESLPLPDTFLEGERAGRCVVAIDRMLVQLYEAPRPEAPETDRQKTWRAPDCAARAQGFSDAEDHDIEHHELTAEEARAVLAFRIDHFARSRAQRTGAWDDGHPYDAAEPDHGCLYQTFAVSGFDPLTVMTEADRIGFSQVRKAGDPIVPP